MEDSKKEAAEIEEIVNEVTGKKSSKQPVVEEAPKVEEASAEEKVEVVNDSDVIDIKDDIVIEDDAPVELPQIKEEKESSDSTSVNVATTDAKTIGTLKPDKQKSPIAMLVLFGALIIFIVFMPTAISLVNKYFGTHLNVDSLNNTPKVDTPVTDDTNKKQEIKMYDLKEDTVIKIDKIDFGGFKKINENGYKISFYVKNTGTALYKFEKKLYLEYYDDNNTFVGRTYLESVKEVSGGISNNYSLITSEAINNKATKVEIIQRTDDDYPAVTLTGKLLTCTNATDTIEYTFDEASRLTNIKDVFTYIKDEDSIKYSNDLVSYKAKVSRLDAIDGVTAVLTETDTGFITTAVIDYQSADYSQLSSNTNYYIKDTYAKTISFEMNAKGYTCR